MQAQKQTQVEKRSTIVPIFESMFLISAVFQHHKLQSLVVLA